MTSSVWKKQEATRIWDELIPLATDLGGTTWLIKKKLKKKEKIKHCYNYLYQNDPITTIWLIYMFLNLLQEMLVTATGD